MAYIPQVLVDIFYLAAGLVAFCIERRLPRNNRYAKELRVMLPPYFTWRLFQLLFDWTFADPALVKEYLALQADMVALHAGTFYDDLNLLLLRCLPRPYFFLRACWDALNLAQIWYEKWGAAGSVAELENVKRWLIGTVVVAGLGAISLACFVAFCCLKGVGLALRKMRGVEVQPPRRGQF